MNISAQDFFLVSLALFSIGIVGVVIRRNAVSLFMAAEIIFNAAALNFVSFSRVFSDPSPQIFVLMIMIVAACEAAVAIVLGFLIFRYAKSADIAKIKEMKW